MFRVYQASSDHDPLPDLLGEFHTLQQAELVAMNALVRWSDETDCDYHILDLELVADSTVFKAEVTDDEGYLQALVTIIEVFDMSQAKVLPTNRKLSGSITLTFDFTESYNEQLRDGVEIDDLLEWVRDELKESFQEGDLTDGLENLFVFDEEHPDV